MQIKWNKKCEKKNFLIYKHTFGFSAVLFRRCHQISKLKKQKKKH